MMTYPKIPPFSDNYLGLSCIVEPKYDGTNIMACWSKNKGWYKFGTRQQLIDRTSEYGNAIHLFLETVAPKIKPKNNTIIFNEYYGPNSIAGIHKPDDKMVITPIDIMVDNEIVFKGLGELKPPTLFSGILTEELINDIRLGRFDEYSKEGVIIKGQKKKKQWIIKVKTDKYKCILQEIYGGNWNSYWE